MILQNLQYPEAGDNERDMYYKFSDEKCYATAGKTYLTLKKGCILHFNTYFNSFSYGKWKKHTILDDLRLRLNLKGSFEILLIRNDSIEDICEEYVLYRQKVVSDELREFEFVYPQTTEKGIVGFRIVAFEDGELQGGYYSSIIDEDSADKINLALCICTYKRENYVIPNMEMLKLTVFSDENSMLRRNLRIYIADNGQTLEPDIFKTDEIKVFPNKNTGGAGGFSRAVIEAINDREKYNITHVILMDDDVVFRHNALERVYAFLRLLKPENKNIMLGGAMLRLDMPFMQFANGETWTVKETIFNKVNYNLHDLKFILRNEIEESINQLAWWFCCFPMDDSTKNNLALPVFFQYDDIDFNQRNNHLKKLTLNGVCLWHENFEKKISVSKEYYAMRNRFIVCSIHGGAKFTKKIMKRSVIMAALRNVMMYRYRAADLLLRAVEDYFRGFEWLASVNPDELNREITQMGYKLQPLDELPIKFEYNKYLKNWEYEETKFKRILRFLQLNGWILKANRDNVIVSSKIDIKAHYYRAKRVLNYDEANNKGFIVEKSYKEAWRVLWRLMKIKRLINKKFNKTVMNYKRDYDKYITMEFWEEFLKIK